MWLNKPVLKVTCWEKTSKLKNNVVQSVACSFFEAKVTLTTIEEKEEQYDIKEKDSSVALINTNPSPAPTSAYLLETPWQLWFFPSNGNWDSAYKDLRKIISIASVDDFWATFNYITTNEKEHKISSWGYWYLFRENVPPIWESPENQEGGRFPFFNSDNNLLYELWLLLCMGAIGESLLLATEDNDNINGVEISGNKGYVKLWMKKICEKLQFDPQYKSRLDHLKVDVKTLTFHPNIDSYKNGKWKMKSGGASSTMPPRI
jgi:hypothetical protein